MDNEKGYCQPILKIDGVGASGKQYDFDITIPNDDRSVIYGIVKDSYEDPVEDAVVKLIEVEYHHDKEKRKPVSHSFTDKNGQFVFGPLCDNKTYEIEIWVNRVQHCKVCKSCFRPGKCLKGVDLDCKPCLDGKPDKPYLIEHKKDKDEDEE